MKKIISFIIVFCMLCSLATFTFAEEEMVKLHVYPVTDEPFTEDYFNTYPPLEGIQYTINEDGSADLVMPKSKHTELLAELQKDLEKSMADIVAEETNSFVKIEHNEEFTEFSIYVDPAKYSFLDSFYSMVFVIVGAGYQEYNGIDIRKDFTCTISFIDTTNNKVLDTSVMNSDHLASLVTFDADTGNNYSSNSGSNESSSIPVKLEADGYVVEIVDIHSFTGDDNLPYIALEAVYSNSNSDARSFSMATSIKTFQNGVQCYRSNMYLTRDFDWDTCYAEVKNGGSLTVFKALPLNNTDEPVEIEISILNNSWREIAKSTINYELN